MCTTFQSNPVSAAYYCWRLNALRGSPSSGGRWFKKENRKKEIDRKISASQERRRKISVILNRSSLRGVFFLRVFFLCVCKYCYKSVLNGFWRCYKDGTTWKLGHDSHETKAAKQWSNTQNNNLKCHSAFDKISLAQPCRAQQYKPIKCSEVIHVVASERQKTESPAWVSSSPAPLKQLAATPLCPILIVPGPINCNLCLPSVCDGSNWHFAFLVLAPSEGRQQWKIKE